MWLPFFAHFALTKYVKHHRRGVLHTGSFITLFIDDANNIYCFDSMDLKNRIAIILNEDSRSHSVMMPAYQVSMNNGSSETNQLTSDTYQFRTGK